MKSTLFEFVVLYHSLKCGDFFIKKREKYAKNVKGKYFFVNRKMKKIMRFS